MSSSISSIKAQNGQALSHTYTTWSSTVHINNVPHRDSTTERDSSVLDSLNLPSMVQDYDKPDSLDRYLKDATVVGPTYGHLFNSAGRSSWSEVDAQARMQAILDEYDMLKLSPRRLLLAGSKPTKSNTFAS